MSSTPAVDVAEAHAYFSAACFNRAWDLIDKAGRTSAEDEQLIRLAHASLWHWTQRPNVTPRNLSIGYWLIARVYVLLGQPGNARRYGELCLEITPQDDQFCLGYAHEALARAAKLAGHSEPARQHLALARRHAAAVTDTGDQQALISDLQTLE